MKIKSAAIVATIATLGFVAPTAVASSAQADQPKPGPSISAEVSSQHAQQVSRSGADLTQESGDALGSVAVGSLITLVNGETSSPDSYFQGLGSVYLLPGSEFTVKGSKHDSDDLSGTLRFRGTDPMPIYAHCPTFKEAYLQIGGHKFWGNAGDIALGGQRFDVRYDGKTGVDRKGYKCWTVVWKGSDKLGTTAAVETS